MPVSVEHVVLVTNNNRSEMVARLSRRTEMPQSPVEGMLLHFGSALNPSLTLPVEHPVSFNFASGLYGTFHRMDTREYSDRTKMHVDEYSLVTRLIKEGFVIDWLEDGFERLRDLI